MDKFKKWDSKKPLFLYVPVPLLKVQFRIDSFTEKVLELYQSGRRDELFELLLNEWKKGNLNEGTRAFVVGRHKYGLLNYMNDLESVEADERILCAFLRHSFYYTDQVDEESGLPHSVHAKACLLMYLAREFMRRRAVEEEYVA